jgi:hypothetical protein
MFKLEDKLPNPFTVDYQYADEPLDLYTEEHMIRFAKTVISECIAQCKEMDTVYRIYQHFGIKYEADGGFTYDLDDMKLAVESPTVTIPKEALESFDAFDKWVVNEQI